MIKIDAGCHVLCLLSLQGTLSDHNSTITVLILLLHIILPNAMITTSFHKMSIPIPNRTIIPSKITMHLQSPFKNPLTFLRLPLMSLVYLLDIHPFKERSVFILITPFERLLSHKIQKGDFVPTDCAIHVNASDL